MYNYLSCIRFHVFQAKSQYPDLSIIVWRIFGRKSERQSNPSDMFIILHRQNICKSLLYNMKDTYDYFKINV